MKKIAIDVREFESGKMTGIGRFLANFLLNADKVSPGLEFILFGNHKTNIPFELPGNFRLIKIREFCPQFWEQLSVPPALKREKADVFFSPYYKRPFFAGIPCVVTVHDLIPLLFPKTFFERRILRWLMGRYLTGAGIITGSRNSMKDINAFFGGITGGVSVVYNAVSLSGGEREFSSEERKEAGIKGKYLLYVGNSNPHKNLPLLAAAYALLPEKLREEYSLVLAGTGKFGPGGLPGKGFVVLPSVKDGLLPGLYAGASLFVFPSLYEGFGLPPVEAMSFGCPVLSSDASCLPEILGAAAEYFDPYDAKGLSEKIRGLLENRERLSELSALGRAKAAEYPAEKFCEGVLAVLKKAAAHGE